MANYDIRPLQLRILKNLLAVDKVCKEHNLRYYIMAGTMLGAVRHKGFIPWDDDLDIGMPRADYDLLMANAKEWLPKPYEAVCAENDKEYPLPFAKVQDADTTLIERMHLKYLGGVYIDIFPLDGVPESRMRKECILRSMSSTNEYFILFIAIHTNMGKVPVHGYRYYAESFSPLPEHRKVSGK